MPLEAIGWRTLYGWLAFVRAVCVEWLADQSLSRDELRDMCLRMLASALGANVEDLLPLD